MWDSIEKSYYPLILYKVFQGTILRIVMFEALKYFTLTTFSVFNNTKPIITIFFGASCLGEIVTK